MYIWLCKRTDHASYDEFNSYVCVAPSHEDALIGGSKLIRDSLSSRHDGRLPLTDEEWAEVKEKWPFYDDNDRAKWVAERLGTADDPTVRIINEDYIHP